MNIAIWIIAVCEVVRLAQNAAQLVMLRKDCKWREDEAPDPEDFCSAGEKEESGE